MRWLRRRCKAAQLDRDLTIDLGAFKRATADEGRTLGMRERVSKSFSVWLGNGEEINGTECRFSVEYANNNSNNNKDECSRPDNII